MQFSESGSLITRPRTKSQNLYKEYNSNQISERRQANKNCLSKVTILTAYLNVKHASAAPQRGDHHTVGLNQI